MATLVDVFSRYLVVLRWLLWADAAEPTPLDWAAAGLVGGAAACLGVLAVTPALLRAGPGF